MKTLLWFWQLPQHLLGLALIVILRARKNDRGIYIVPPLSFGGVSLGEYIILDEWLESLPVSKTVEHERGHSKQSRYLGPLYLLIVGIPSALMNLMSRYSRHYGSGKFSDGYYDRWPETWADRLGGVERS